jgi:hypothetical protein
MKLSQFQDLNNEGEILDFKSLDELHISFIHKFLQICLLLILKHTYTSKIISMGGVGRLRRQKNVKLPPENSHREKEGGRIV